MKTESIKRSQFMVLINTTPSAETPTYNLVGDGVTELSVNYGAQTKTEQYINQDSATTDITGYQPTSSVSQTAKKGDPVYEYVNTIRKNRAILSDAYTDIIMADAYEVANGNLTEIPAERQPVSISIDTYGGSASDPLSITYAINFRGNSTQGTFNATDKSFTESTSA